MSNGFKSAQRWIDEHEKHERACQQIMMEAAAKCAPIKAMMSEVKKAAKNDGISIKVFSAALLERKHLRNAAAVRDKLEDEDMQDELDEFRRHVQPVADLPLFGAAIEAAEEKVARSKASRAKKRSEALDSLTDDEAPGPDAFEEMGDPRPRHLRDKADETVTGQDAVDRLKSGITALN